MVVGGLTLSVLMAALGFVAAAGAAERCPGPPAPAGVVVRGPVLLIPDASSICVARSQSPSTWVEIALPNLNSTRSALMAAAFGKTAACSVDSAGRGRCLIEGASLADALQRPEVVRDAAAWR